MISATAVTDHENTYRRYNDCIVPKEASAKSAGGCDGTVHKGRYAVRERHDGQAVYSGFHHRVVIGKKREEWISEQVNSHTDGQPDQKRIGQADDVAFQNPFFFPCAQVLGNKA